MESLQDLLEHELKDLYSAEQQLVKTLPKMAKAAASDELREAIEHHLEETRKYVERLGQTTDTENARNVAAQASARTTPAGDRMRSRSVDR